MVGTVLEEIREGLGELRRTVAALRAPVEADLALAPALKRLAGGFEQATGITVHLAVPDDLPEMVSSQRHALYRGAQEGLTNVQKHANASDAWVELAQDGGSVTLTVRDNGAGLSSADGATGFGLHGLRERASQLGGQLSVQTTLDGGAELILTLPVNPENDYG
jgi:signal transduction histidine kinase